jgi:hypothetical protein
MTLILLIAALVLLLVPHLFAGAVTLGFVLLGLFVILAVAQVLMYRKVRRLQKRLGVDPFASRRL